MTPEQIQYVREWAKRGNEWRVWDVIMSGFSIYHTPNGEMCRLNSAGLTIARLADALEQACETAEESQAWVGSPGLDDEIETMRANRKELLG